MKTRLKNEAEILAFCAEVRKMPLEELPDAMQLLEQIDCSKYPTQVVKAVGDALFFACWGAERDPERGVAD